MILLQRIKRQQNRDSGEREEARDEGVREPGASMAEGSEHTNRRKGIQEEAWL